MEWLRRRLTRRAGAGESKSVAGAGQGAKRASALRRCWQAVRGCCCVGQRCRRSGSLDYWETDDLVEYIRWLTRQHSHVSVASRPRFYIGSEESSLCNWEGEARARGCLNGEECREGERPRVIFYIGSGSSSLASQEGDADTGAFLSSQQDQEGVRPRAIFYIGSATSSLASSQSADGADDCAALQLPQDTGTRRATFYIGSDTSSLESF